MSIKKIIIALLCLPLLFDSCKKTEGKGGKYSIEGKIFAKYYDNDLTVYTGSGYAADVDVFLVYGDEPGYGEKSVTGYDGSYSFKYLRKGKYKLYVYSKDTLGQSPTLDVPVVKEIDLSGDVELEDLVIVREEKRDLNSGPYAITGTVMAYDCDASFSSCVGPYAAIDVDVFLTFGNNISYSDRVITGPGGKYQFLDLPNGTYKVYAISKNQFHISNPTLPRDTAMTQTVVINGASITAPNIDIIQ